MQELGKSSCHDNHTGKIQSSAATKGGPTTKGGCGSSWETGFQSLGIVCLPGSRSKAQMVRPVRPKTCRQTAQLWGTQTTGASLLKQEVGSMVMDIIQNYKTNASSSREERLQEAWDYVQAQVKCCGWASFYNWTDNLELRNSTENIYPCSCEETMEEDNQYIVKKGFCKVSNSSSDAIFHEEWPVYKEGCMKKVQMWLQENLGILLGVCVGVAVIELLGLFLSICLCRHIHSEDYSKVPKY